MDNFVIQSSDHNLTVNVFEVESWNWL